MGESKTEVPQIWQGEPGNASQHAEWIAGRVMTLLSHYFQPDNPAEVQEAAIDDWIDALAPFSQISIDLACKKYIRDQPRRRPTPGDIRSKIRAPSTASAKINNQGDKTQLTPDELELLETKILPTARRWLNIPGLAEHGRETLEYWGEGFDQKEGDL